MQKNISDDNCFLIETNLSEEGIRKVIARACCEQKSEEKKELFVTSEEMDNWDIVLQLMEKYGTTNAGILDNIPYKELYKTSRN